MSKPARRRQLQSAARKFLRLRGVQDLSKLLGVEEFRLQLIATQPQYRIFSIPKPNGEQRWIEDPEDRLKDIQDTIAYHLGAVYYFNQTTAAYGFVFSAREDEQARNVATNAMQHLGAKWLFNADLKDFFHQVKTEDIFRVFSGNPFNFTDDLANLLAKITTSQGRLPMGAPTSPVLSNWASLPLDRKLLELASWANWTYTRYADDLTFSSKTKISAADRTRIQSTVSDLGLAFNPDKFKLRGPGEAKEVTGIMLGDGELDLPPDFLADLRRELTKLRNIMEVANRMGRRERWIERFQKQVKGKVAFATFVNGEKDPVSRKLNDALIDALDPPDEFGAMRWVDFGYFQ